MNYELDFIGVNDDSAKCADAIGIRWENPDGLYTIGVYDGGFEKYGEALKNHINTYYSISGEKPVIDFVICSHSDKDHVSGLKIILENFNVKKLYMNRPWLYASSLIDNADDGRITVDSLVKRLKDNYSFICELEEIAINNGTAIYEAFQGQIIEKHLIILNPSKEFYIKKLIESSKTPLTEGKLFSIESILHKSFDSVKKLFETWTNELLREYVITSPENEQSVIIYGDMSSEKFLLTGDAGKEALINAMDYADMINTSIADNVAVYQIPHHGGRHNVTPCLLNRLIGNIVPKETAVEKTAIVSAAKASDHPKKMVVNAFVRRGVSVFSTKGSSLQHHKGLPLHEGWRVASHLNFSSEVETWKEV